VLVSSEVASIEFDSLCIMTKLNSKCNNLHGLCSPIVVPFEIIKRWNQTTLPNNRRVPEHLAASLVQLYRDRWDRSPSWSWLDGDQGHFVCWQARSAQHGVLPWTLTIYRVYNREKHRKYYQMDGFRVAPPEVHHWLATERLNIPTMR